MGPDINTAGVMEVMEERQSIIKEFEWAITDLQKTVEELHVRLVPVTSPAFPDDTLSDPLPPSSEARSRLHDLQGTTASLRGLLNRLEV